ncbi:hypothetical protein F4V47_02215 [Lactococcus garvieae subsp. garvieae]|uniref:hypothetical protein n=1 Tax=Lactococcus garvieae TaxID=1363 RepID=UPI0005A77506|nr:hypothetical protein [Lactococcus garvieae]KAA8718391.1 hypothetical protein F4V47_02215 [Lactococcus garvieae subsp. garvieae]PCS03478.1 hypothetical protein RU85_GL000836 [Lactococcus garvieae]
MNKNSQTYIFSGLMFLAGSFLIFISEDSIFTDFDSLLGLLVVIQSSFILSDIGSFIFQKVAFMERAEELGYYKKQWPKIQVISYFMALTIFTLTSSLDVIVVLMTVFLIVTNTVIRAYFTSIRMLKLMCIQQKIKEYFFGGVLGLAFILLLTHFNFYTVTFFSALLLSRTFWNFKLILSHASNK